MAGVPGSGEWLRWWPPIVRCLGARWRRSDAGWAGSANPAVRSPDRSNAAPQSSRARSAPVRYNSWPSRARWARRSAPPVLHGRPIPILHQRPDRAPQPLRDGPRQERFLPCHSMPSGLRPSCSAPSPMRATRSQPRSSARRSRSSSSAATCSPARRPAPARPPRSSCRSSRSSTRRARPGQPARNLPSQQGRRSTPATARPPVRVLVVVPTRELAIQVEESVRTYGKHRPIRSTTIYGGVGFEPQVAKLRAGPEIVVATPGRLLDHVGQRTIDLSRVEILVLDEADRLLDMGFIRDIRRILELLPPRRQNLLFSATFSDDVRSLATGLLHEPARVQVTPRNSTTELIEQVVIPVDRERKRELLSHLIRSGRIDQALVFTRTKHGANRLAEQLGKDGIDAAAIHGNKSQGQRVRALDRLQGRPRGHPGRDRHRRPWPRHRAAAPCRQLRAADGGRGLRPPHRPHGSCRQGRRGDLARVRRRTARSSWTSRHSSGARSRPRPSPASSPTGTSAPSRSACAPRRPSVPSGSPLAAASRQDAAANLRAGTDSRIAVASPPGAASTPAVRAASPAGSAPHIEAVAGRTIDRRPRRPAARSARRRPGTAATTARHTRTRVTHAPSRVSDSGGWIRPAEGSRTRHGELGMRDNADRSIQAVTRVVLSCGLGRDRR